jgi:hypothetical protein
MFADDTTLYLNEININVAILKFQRVINSLLTWCEYNKMDINWSKTYFMVITKQRVNKIETIKYNNININVVSSFKLLGVIIDNKLTFNDFIRETKKNINKKLYSIKRLFYLAHSVKLQFFKSFIMPYFNYCLTLSIYFAKTSLQSLSNCYYLCLYKLFKFKAVDDLNLTNNNLEIYKLHSFQHHIIIQLFSFIHKIVNNPDAPIILKEKICVRTEQTGYHLRTRTVTMNPCSLDGINYYSFDNFFSLLITEFCPNDINLEYNFFKIRIFNNINVLYTKFVNKFKKFMLLTKNCSYLDNYNVNNQMTVH